MDFCVGMLSPLAYVACEKALCALFLSKKAFVVEDELHGARPQGQNPPFLSLNRGHPLAVSTPGTYFCFLFSGESTEEKRGSKNSWSRKWLFLSFHQEPTRLSGVLWWIFMSQTVILKNRHGAIFVAQWQGQSWVRFTVTHTHKARHQKGKDTGPVLLPVDICTATWPYDHMAQFAPRAHTKKVKIWFPDISDCLCEPSNRKNSQ